jgi:hypothetical protein
MTDLSDDSMPEWTEDELALLRTADADRPSPRSLPATLTAVSAGATIATIAAAAKGATAALGSSSAVTTAKAASSFVLVKWVGGVVLAGAIVTGGAVIVQRAELGKAASSPGEGRVVNVPRDPSPAVRAVTPTPEPVPSVPPVALGESTPPGAPQAGAGALDKVPTIRAQPDISQEIAALDEARKLLRGGRPKDALSALDRYDARYAKSGSLRIEASTLRIEALLQSGNRARATTLANAFLARHPRSPYAARVRALIGEGPAGRPLDERPAPAGD